MDWNKKYYKIDFKIYYKICMIVILIAGISIAFFMSLYAYWKNNVDQENGYNSIDSLIAVIGVVLNILTIIFIYKTYQAQQEQIAEQKKQIEDQKQQIKKNDSDVEYNRGLDLIYRQLEHTNKNLGMALQGDIIETFPIFPHSYFPYISTINIVYSTLVSDSSIISKYLDNSILDVNTKEMLFKTFSNNLDRNLKKIHRGFNYGIGNNKDDGKTNSLEKYVEYVKRTIDKEPKKIKFENIKNPTERSYVIALTENLNILKVSNSKSMYKETLELNIEFKEILKKYNIERL